MSAIANWVRKHLKDTMTGTAMESSQNSQVESNNTKNNRNSINCPRCKEKIECGNISEHLIICSKSNKVDAQKRKSPSSEDAQFKDQTVKKSGMKCGNCQEVIGESYDLEIAKKHMITCQLSSKLMVTVEDSDGASKFQCILCTSRRFQVKKRGKMLKHLRRSHLDDQDDIQCPRCKDKVKIDNVVKHLESCEKFGKFIETMAAFQCSLCAAENQEIRFFNTEDMFKHFTAEHSVFCHFLSKLSNRPNQNDQQGQANVKEDSTEKLSQEASKYIDGTLCLICGIDFDSTLEHIVGKHSETVLKLSKIPGIFSPEHEKILDTEIENGQSTEKQKTPMVQIRSESFDTSGFESDDMTEKSNGSSITVVDLDSGSENANIGIKDSIAKTLDFDNLTDDEKKNHETSITVLEQDSDIENAGTNIKNNIVQALECGSLTDKQKKKRDFIEDNFEQENGFTSFEITDDVAQALNILDEDIKNTEEKSKSPPLKIRNLSELIEPKNVNCNDTQKSVEQENFNTIQPSVQNQKPMESTNVSLDESSKKSVEPQKSPEKPEKLLEKTQKSPDLFQKLLDLPLKAKNRISSDQDQKSQKRRGRPRKITTNSGNSAIKLSDNIQESNDSSNHASKLLDKSQELPKGAQNLQNEVQKSPVGSQNLSNQTLNLPEIAQISPDDGKISKKILKLRNRSLVLKLTKLTKEEIASHTNPARESEEKRAPKIVSNSQISVDKTKQVQCLYCDSFFGNKSQMNEHIEKIQTLCLSENVELDRSELTDEQARKFFHEEPKFQCSYCNNMFWKLSYLNDHIKETHEVKRKSARNEKLVPIEEFKAISSDLGKKEEKNGYLCSICKASFTMESGLKKHVTLIHPQVSKEIAQPKQNEVEIPGGKDASPLEKLGTSKKSATEETGVRNVKCLIPKCDVLFLTDGPMKQHLTKAHQMNKREIAKLMLGVSVSKKSEKSTVKEKEMLKNGGSQMSCTFCDTKFSDKIAMKIHICKGKKQISSSPEKLQNDLPDKSQNNLPEKALVPKKSVNTNVKCNQCDSWFRGQSFLEKHILVVHEEKNPHQCFCGAGFLSIQSLNEHIGSEHQEVIWPLQTNDKSENKENQKFDDLRKLKCSLCSATFLDKSILDQHISWHAWVKDGKTKKQIAPTKDNENTPEKFQCKFCNSSFESSDRLHKHLETYAACKKFDKFLSTQIAEETQKVVSKKPDSTESCEISQPKPSVKENQKNNEDSRPLKRKLSENPKTPLKNSDPQVEKTKSSDLLACLCGGIFNKLDDLTTHVEAKKSCQTKENLEYLHIMQDKEREKSKFGSPDKLKTPEKSKDLVVFEFSENEQDFGKLPKTPRTTKPFKDIPPKAFQCSDCKESYNDQFALFEHIANVHDDDNTNDEEEEAASEESQEIPSQGDEPSEESMECLFCNSNFMNSLALEDHLRISESCMKAVSEHMKKIEESAIKNDQTSKDSKNSKKLQSNSDKKDDFKCSTCDAEFEMKSDFDMHMAMNVEDHMALVHDGKKDTRKVILVHEGEMKNTTTSKVIGDGKNRKRSLAKNEFKCLICQSVFISKANLDKHNIFVHEGKGFQCQTCDQASKNVFGTKVEINQHITKTHREGHIVSVLDSSFQCLFCDLDFKNSSQVYGHVQMNHVITLKNGLNIDSFCVYCKSSFVDLARHLKGIHDMKKEVRYVVKFNQGKNIHYKCALCNFKHTTKNSLAYHMSTVHDGKNEIDAMKKQTKTQKRSPSPDSDLEVVEIKKQKIDTELMCSSKQIENVVKIRLLKSEKD